MSQHRAQLFLPLFAVIVLALLVGGCSKGKHRSQATPAPSDTSLAAPATPAPTPTPEVINGVEVTPLTLEKSVPVPPDHVFYIEGGCYQCDGPATSLDRVYIDQAGVYHSDRLFELNEPDAPGRSYITGIAVSTDGYQIVVSTCSIAYCGGVGNIQPNAHVTLTRSLDGGITWADIGGWDGGGAVRAVNNGIALVGRTIAEPGGGAVTHFATYPGGDEIGTLPVSPDGYVMTVGRKALVLRAPDKSSFSRLFGGDVQATITPHLPANANVTRIEAMPSGGFLVLWFIEGKAPGSPFIQYLGVLPANSTIPTHIYRYADGAADIGTNVSFLDARTVATNVSVASPLQDPSRPANVSLPGILDLNAATLTPIYQDEFRQRLSKGDRTFIEAVGNGPVLKVQGTGDCLNIRSAPSAAAAVTDCYPDGVLLLDRGDTRASGGQTWVSVGTPSRHFGWASAQFLDTAGRDMAPKAPAGAETADGAVNAIVTALDSGDNAKVVPLVGYMQVECDSHPGPGLGPPPTCPPGVADGTPVDAFPAGGCEGVYLSPQGIAAGALRFYLGTPVQAIFRTATTSTWYPTDYEMVYGSGAPGSFVAAMFVRNGKIVGTNGCIGTTADALKDVPASDILFKK
jgi:hypothetical protein